MASRSYADSFFCYLEASFGPNLPPPGGAFGGPGGHLGGIFSASLSLGGLGENRRPPQGPRGGPRGRKKVLQDGSWRLLADLKTRFQPKSAPKRAPRGLQDGSQNGLKSKKHKSVNVASRVGESVIFDPRRVPTRTPNGLQIAANINIGFKIYKHLVQEGSERARKAKTSSMGTPMGRKNNCWPGRALGTAQIVKGSLYGYRLQPGIQDLLRKDHQHSRLEPPLETLCGASCGAGWRKNSA